MTLIRRIRESEFWNEACRRASSVRRGFYRFRAGNLSTASQRTLTVCSWTLVGFLSVGILFSGWQYFRWGRTVNERLRQGAVHPSARIFSAPNTIAVGEKLRQDELLMGLRSAGFSRSADDPSGHVSVKGTRVEIRPRSQAKTPAAQIHFKDGRIARIVSLPDGKDRKELSLAPLLVTTLFDEDRAKQRLVQYQEIPLQLRNAILAVEDHRFFRHGGIDVMRTARAAYEGLREWRKPSGTSTLTQQLARGFFLKPERTYTRKFSEMLIALQLESRLTKEQIFEHYLNHVYMGRWGSFDIVGLGEAAHVFFSKDVRDLTLAESALLAGIIQRPSYLNPHRRPGPAKNRRNLVLRLMLDHGLISRQNYEKAAREPIRLVPQDADISDAPYFVDLARQELLRKFSEEELLTRGYRVYTTLDLDLQRAAVEAVRQGMAEVDKQLSKQKRFAHGGAPRAEAALIALDPRTGEVKAVVGGRDYDYSQLNRSLAWRQPGSTFKPFVFAAAIGTALHGGAGSDAVLTPVSLVEDEPTSISWKDEVYQPTNFGGRFYGPVSLRDALFRSLNVATVRVAEKVGYREVVRLARRAGLGGQLAATPSAALGSYEVTPLQLAESYTVFANQGSRTEPYLIRRIETAEGRVLVENAPRTREVLDPRVAYIVTNMMEDVLNRGTGYRARSMGFREPAAGKTGTDDDGWFAGFTRNLLCVVWVGLDDNTDLGLKGASSALPIWAEFMKRAHSLPAYRNPPGFPTPSGVVAAAVDPETGLAATASCPQRRNDVFIDGTQPATPCWHGTQFPSLVSKVEGLGRRVVKAAFAGF